MRGGLQNIIKAGLNNKTLAYRQWNAKKKQRHVGQGPGEKGTPR